MILVGMLSAVLAFGAPADVVEEAKKLASPGLAGANQWGCEPSAAHPRPVVLVHGTFATGALNWTVVATKLAARGYCVYSLDHGKKPNVPVFAGLASIETSANQVKTFVDGVLKVTGADEVDLIGYSLGGPVARHYLRFLGGAAKVRAHVGLAPSSHGTTPQGLAKLAEHFPGAVDVLFTDCDACRDQVAGSAALTKLNESHEIEPGVEYTVIATRYDEVVTPYQSQFLAGEGVRNLTLQDLCFLSLAEHFTLTSSPIALHETKNVLDPSRPQTTTCLSILED